MVETNGNVVSEVVMQRVVRLVAVVTAVLILMPAAANAAAGASIASLAATVGAHTVTVTGKALFTGDEVVVANDSSGDGIAPGSDILSARITQDTPGRITFALHITDNAQPLPEVLFYNWLFQVDADDTPVRYMLKASRSSYGSTQSSAPLFELWSEPDAQGVYGTVANVAGTTSGTRITWVLDAASIGAVPGTTISPQSVASVSTSAGFSVGVPGVATGGMSTVYLDGAATEDAYKVIAPTVALGIAPAGTAADQVNLTVTVPVKANSTFSGTLGKPSPGAYVVVARGCIKSVCAVRTTPVTVP